MQTRDQKYATIVHDQVSRIENQEGYKQYGAMAHKLPILIRTAGLTQALEFVNTRGKGLQKQLLEDLAITVEQNDTANLLKSVRSANLSEYMSLTQHIMAALLWYKRFAQSILKVDASEAALLPEENK
jgi:CRISPR-associated protein Cmr5